MADLPNLTPLMNHHINGLNESKRLKDFRRSLMAIIGSASYKSWFYQTKLEEDPKTGYIKWVCDCIWFNGQLVKRFGSTVAKINKDMELTQKPEPLPMPHKNNKDHSNLSNPKYLH